MTNYFEIEQALKFAHEYNASNVTVEIDNGVLTDTPYKISNVFDNLEIGESFTLISINWEA